MINSDIIKSKINIREYIGKTVSLKQKSHGEFLGLCPFHNEKTPSFTVSEIKGFFHCFGCGINGDVIAFVMQRNGLNYVDAVQKIADESGIKLEINQKNLDSYNNAKKIIEINTCAAKWYHEQLLNNQNHLAEEYLKQRRLGSQIIISYQLGYAPSSGTEFINFMLEKFSKNDLIDAKVLVNRNGQLKNPFGGRIIFPILDSSGKVVGFGGRIIDKNNEVAKYINSAETEAFHKSQVFYGLFAAQKYLRDKKINSQQSGNNQKEHLLVVEGYMDVLSLANHGFGTAIAPLGANVKVEQLQYIWKYDPSPIVCLDNDVAGQNAMLRLAVASLEYISPECTVRFLLLKDGKDPDEVLTKNGIQYWNNNVMPQAVGVVDFIAQHQISKLSESPSPEEKALLRQNLQKTTQAIKNHILRKEYQSHLENIYWQYVRNLRKNFSVLGYSKNISIIKAKEQELLKEKRKDLGITDNLEVMFAILLQNQELMEDQELYELLWRLEISNDILEEIRCYIYNNNTEISSSARKLVEKLHSLVVLVDKTTFMRCYQLHCTYIIFKQIKDIENKISDLYHSQEYSQDEMVEMENNLLELKKLYLLQQKMVN